MPTLYYRLYVYGPPGFGGQAYRKVSRFPFPSPIGTELYFPVDEFSQKAGNPIDGFHASVYGYGDLDDFYMLLQVEAQEDSNNGGVDCDYPMVLGQFLIEEGWEKYDRP